MEVCLSWVLCAVR